MRVHRIRKLVALYPVVAAVATAAAVALVGAGVGLAYWTVRSEPIRVNAHAVTMPSSGKPTASGNAGTVRLSWAASDIVPGHRVDGYLVTRYDAAGLAQTPKGTCGVVVADSECTDPGVPTGTYTYRVRAKQGVRWIGPPSPPSDPVTVSTTEIEFPAAGQSYGIAAYGAGCGPHHDICGSTGGTNVKVSVRRHGGAYWLPGSGFTSDTERFMDATGTKNWKLAFPITNFSVAGQYSVHVVSIDSTGRESPASVTFSVVPTAPQAPTVASGPPPLANSTDTTLSFGGLPDGSVLWCAIGKREFQPCSNPLQLTAVEGENSVRAQARDSAGNESPVVTHTWTVDTTAPAAQDVQALNGNGMAGVPDQGDTVTLSYSEAVDPRSLANDWDGTTPLAVRIRIDAAGQLAVLDGADGRQLASVGMVSTGRSSGVTASATALLDSGQRLVITVGVLDGAAGQPSAIGNVRWAPGPVRDLAGNVLGGGEVSEKGAGDIDF